MNSIKILLICILFNVILIKFTNSYSNGKDNENKAIDFVIENVNKEKSEPKTIKSLFTIENSTASLKRYPIAEFDFEHVQIPFVICIWILFSIIFKIIFQVTSKLPKYFPESCMLIVIGLVIGVLLRFGLRFSISPLTSTIFFLYILPPIIFDAGYFMPNRMFFDNLGTILLMAVVGTIFNIFAIGLSLWGFGLTGLYGNEMETPNFAATLLFTSVIAATDPVAVLAAFEEIHVNELLYIIVFGESLLNDAVTVVIYHMMEVYNDIGIENVLTQDLLNGFISFFIVSLGGTFIGILWGFLTGFLTRFTHHVLIVEPIFIFIMGYLSYLNAEMFHMSGILDITFCGITMKNYVESNVTENSKITIRHGLKMIANSSETVVFILLGVATIQSQHVWNSWFVLLTVIFCTVFRILAIIILIAFANAFRLNKLSYTDQTIMSLGGLRGAVAFALVLLVDEHIVPQKNMFLTTTIVIIFFTVFLQGIIMKPILKWLNVKLMEKRQLTMNERISQRFLDHTMAGFEDVIGNIGNYNLREKFKRFNKTFIEPLLLRDVKQSERKVLETYAELRLKDALEILDAVPEIWLKSNKSLCDMKPETETQITLENFQSHSVNCENRTANNKFSPIRNYHKYVIDNPGYVAEPEENDPEIQKVVPKNSLNNKCKQRKRLNSV